MYSGWCITKDPLDCGRIGYGQISREQVQKEAMQWFARQIFVETDLDPSQINHPVRFRCIDEDGEVHYEGVITDGWLNSHDEVLCFAPLTFATADTGATIMQYLKDGGSDSQNKWVTL